MAGKKDTTRSANLLDLKPVRILQWETKENGSVVLLVPKFHNPLLVRYLVPHLAKPFIRLELDETGSFVWQECDGAATVAVIADRMKKRFGEEFDPEYERVGRFIRQLLRNEFIRLE
jgi:hypothetical protein